MNDTIALPAPARSRRLRPLLPAFLLLSPLVIFIVAFFVVPMLYVFYISFFQGDDINATGVHLGLTQYATFFTDPYYLKSLWLSLRISFYSVLVCLLLGYPIALTMSHAEPRARGILTLLVASPLLVSIVVRNFGWYLLLMPTGTLNLLLMHLGLIHSPLKLMFSVTGVVIGLSNAYLPFMILAIATSLYNIDPSLEKAGAILGASPWKTFWSVTFPLSLPGVVSGMVLVFSLSISAYITPALMGGANVPVLPTQVYEQIINNLRWPFGSAISFGLLGVTLAIIVVFTRLIEHGRYKEAFR